MKVKNDRELRAFAKVALAPDEEREVRFSLNRRAFAYYDPAIQAWEVKTGSFDVLVGSSSRDQPLQATVAVRATQGAVKTLTRQSMIKAFRVHPRGQAFYAELVKALGFTELLDTAARSTTGLIPEQVAERQKAQAAELVFANEMPVNKIPALSGGVFSEARLDEILRAAAAYDEV